MASDDRKDVYETPSAEMISEDDPIGWLAKSDYPTRSKAKAWAVGELGIDFTEARVRTTWIRGLTAEERQHDEWMGGYSCAKDHPAAVEFWEVRYVNA